MARGAQDSVYQSETSKGKKIDKYDKYPNFVAFWNAYPRGENKHVSLERWVKINPDKELFNTIMKSLEDHKKSEKWRQGYIPHASTWLNQRRWEDELSEPTNQGQSMPEDRRVTRYVSQGGYRDFSDLVE